MVITPLGAVIFLDIPRHFMRQDTKQQYLHAYDEYADAIYRHCFFRVFSKPLAEELTQETFLKTWQYLDQGKKVDNLRAFLYRVANNLVIDYVRKKKEDRLDALLENSPELEPMHDARGDIETAELARNVIATMETLREDEREILTMRYIDELDLKEIAEILDISVNNVSVRLNRAMKALRKELPTNDLHDA
jgi:RNA polymerase sigma-70 factor (ECF subfamily)